MNHHLLVLLAVLIFGCDTAGEQSQKENLAFTPRSDEVSKLASLTESQCLFSTIVIEYFHGRIFTDKCGENGQYHAFYMEDLNIDAFVPLIICEQDSIDDIIIKVFLARTEVLEKTEKACFAQVP